MDVIERLHRLCLREHDCTVDVIEALVECERTRAHIDRGHDGLWSLLVDELEYSHAAATRRLKATRCAVKFPVVLKWMRRGRVNVSALEAVAPLLDVIGTPQQLLHFIQGRTAAEIARSVARERPRPAHREHVRREFVRVTIGDGPELFGDSPPDDAKSIEAGSHEATAELSRPTHSSSAALRRGSSALSHPHETTLPRVAPDDHTPAGAPAELGSADSAVGRPALERIRVSLNFGPDEFADLERARAILSRRTGRVPSLHETLMEVTRFYLRQKIPKKRNAAAAREREHERVHEREPGSEPGRESDHERALDPDPARERAATGALHRGSAQSHTSTPRPDAPPAPLTGAATSDRYSSTCVPSSHEAAELVDSSLALGSLLGSGESLASPESPTSLEPLTSHQAPNDARTDAARAPDPESGSGHAPTNRHIPRAVRDAVLLRDGERCTFVGPDGRRCNSTFALQIDHIHPFALGGTHDLSNLRVLCGVHNRREAEKVFGRRTRVPPT